MTREKWAKLSPEEQRIKVAEHDDWHSIRPTDYAQIDVADIGTSSDLEGLRRGRLIEGYLYVPDYLRDLNAMHEAVELSTMMHSWWDCQFYTNWLLVIIGETRESDSFNLTHATAAQRAEAFVLAMEAE